MTGTRLLKYKKSEKNLFLENISETGMLMRVLSNQKIHLFSEFQVTRMLQQFI